MPLTLRRGLLGFGLAGLLLYGGLAARVYRTSSNPEDPRSAASGYGWVLGPSARALSAAADERIDRSLEILEDRARPAPDRIRAYRDELRIAETLLVRSLRAHPAQARPLAQIAAVRWELQQPLDEAAARRHVETLALASAAAPTAPRVQLQLGELLLKMGRQREALPYFHRAASLDTGVSGAVVSRMRDYLFGAEEILRALPPQAGVLAALYGPFLEEGQERAYLDVVENHLARAGAGIDAPLLRAYGNAGLKAGDPGRTRERLEALGALDDADADAERLRQTSRASLALDDPVRALDEARQARKRSPSPPYVEYLGDVLLAGGAESEAIPVFRESLRIVAAGTGNAATRARLYRKIGQAEERSGRMDRAYDAYRLALGVDPDEPYAARRIGEMERAAGVAQP